MSDPIDPIDHGLDDHSEELFERNEVDAQIRFYRAMADTEINYNRVLDTLARAVAEVIFDLCLVYLLDEQTGELSCAAAYHPDPRTLQSLRATFVAGPRAMGTALVRRVISRRESYFRPRWRPSLLQAYGENASSDQLDITIHSLIAVPMVTTEGTRLGALVVGRHTTARSYNEADLALSQWIASHAAMKLETARLYRNLHETNRQLDAAVQERDTFISIASHELRTPLGALKLQAQTLTRLAEKHPERFSPETVIPKLTAIDHQVDRMAMLIDQLLNVTRIIEGGLTAKLEEVELAPILEEVTRRFCCELETHSIDLSVHCPETLTGFWDRERLDHIATNLLSNAIKYGQGNPIDIEVRADEQKVQLFVRDQGIGIPPEARQRIFERFQRASKDRRYKGLGLGLWIVREYVHSMSGTIEVDSIPGLGSQFIVTLPLRPPGPPPA